MLFADFLLTFQIPKFVFLKTDKRLMHVKSIAKCSVLPIFEWPLKTGVTVVNKYS